MGPLPSWSWPGCGGGGSHLYDAASPSACPKAWVASVLPLKRLGAVGVDAPLLLTHELGMGLGECDWDEVYSK